MIYTKILFCCLIMVLFIGRCNTGTTTGFACSTTCCCGDFDKLDPYLFVGEILNMTCTLTKNTSSKGVNSSDLYLYFNEDEVVNETTVVNSTSLGMSIMMTVPFSKVLYCELKRTVPEFDTTTVDVTTVKVEYAPIAAKNFNCIIYDWDAGMECTWDLGVKYMDERSINTTLFWAFPNGGWKYCPKLELLKCTWNIADTVIFDHSTLLFTINVKNTKRNVTASTNMITIQQDDYVKPNKVEYLFAKTLNNTCASLEWRHRKIYRTKQFIISINSKWNDNKTKETNATKCDIINSNSTTCNGNLTATICNLRPNTLYDFTIETVPAIGKGYRSDKVSNWTFTDISVPDRPPELVDGAYSADNKNCDKNKRDVVVYWKSLPLEYQNGPLLGYYVSISDYNSLLYDIPIKDSSRLYYNLTLPCNQQMTVAIKSWGKAGNSSASSKIVIPKYNAIAIPKYVIVEAQKNSTDTSVSVSWTPVEQDGIISFTIFYCQYDTECTNDISWITVEPNYTSNTLDHIQFDKNYRFGVSADVHGLSSGFEWQTCHYFKSSDVRPPSTVDVIAYPENSISVDWSDPLCENSPYIEYYTVTWCIADEPSKQCQGAQSEKKIKSTEETYYVIRNLDAQTTYGIRVQQVAGDGRTSDFSEMKYIKPTNSDLLAGEIAGISAGSAFLFILAVAGIIFILRTCRRGITEIRKPYKIDTIPIKGKAGDPSLCKDVPKDYKKIPYESQISTDSGKGSLTSDIPSPGIKQGLGELGSEKEECGKRMVANMRGNPDYSKITINSVQSKLESGLEVYNQNTVPCSPVSDTSLHMSSDSKSNSEVTCLPHPDYVGHGVGNIGCKQNDHLDSYVRHQDIHGDETENADEIPYISRSSPQQLKRKNGKHAEAVEPNADSFETLPDGNEENVSNDSNLPSVGFRGTDHDQKTEYIRDFGLMYSKKDEPTEESLILPNICAHPQILSNYDDRECSEGYKEDNVFSAYITEQALQGTCGLSGQNDSGTSDSSGLTIEGENSFPLPLPVEEGSSDESSDTSAACLIPQTSNYIRLDNFGVDNSLKQF